MSAPLQRASDPVRQLLTQKPGSLYALYDAAQDQSLLALLASRGIAHDCLYGGIKMVTLKNVAPYVFSCSHFAHDPAGFIDEIWLRGVSMLVESDEPVERLRVQLKKLAYVKNSAGVECYFRYYDARAYSRFMRAATQEQLGQLFGSTIRAIYWVDTASQALVGLRRQASGLIARLLDPHGAQFHLQTLA